MNYSETKEKSAEILRAVIGLMAQHDAPFNPLTFTLWYEHVAGINPSLSYALKCAISGQERLTNVSVQRLFREHIATPEHPEMIRITEQFQQTMAGMAHIVITAHNLTNPTTTPICRFATTRKW